jgi:tetratricopeptide (TPR) repeat protein
VQGTTGLWGRDSERASLLERIADAASGRGGLVLLTGEAGIGKSALSDAVANEAERRGFRVLVGRAWEFADAPAYLPLKAGLRALGVTPALPVASDAEVYGLWEDVLESLARESQRAPILWQIEDLHAADAQSIELLSFLADNLRATRVLVIGTARSLGRLTRMARARSAIELGPLGAPEVRSLAEQVLGRAIAPDVLPIWMEKTGGNPLFVVECARAVRAGRPLETVLPDSIVQLVVERLEALPRASRSWVEQGAVLGRELTAATLARLGDDLPAAVIDGLLPALRTRLLEEIAPGRFRFGHALIRDAIEQSIPAEQRRAHHARVESVLAEQGGGADVLIARAQHAIHALGALPEDRVREVVTRAVSALEAEAARDRAFELWRRWLDAAGTEPDAESLLELSRLASAASRHGEGRRAAEAAFALVKAADDPLALARAALAQGASLRPGVVDPAHVRALEWAASRISRQREPKLACLLEARLAAALQPSSDPARPIGMARGAVAFARGLGDPELLREVLTFAGSALTFFVETPEVHALSGELLELSLAAGDAERALRAFMRRVIGHLELGELDQFDSETERMLGLAREMGHPALAWRALLMGSMRALARGNFEESERFVTELEQISSLVDDPALALSLLAHQALRACALDDEMEIRRVFEENLERMAESARPFDCTIRATLALQLGDREAAAAEVTAYSRVTRLVPPDSAMLGSFGQVVAFAGSTELREAMLEQLAPLAGREIHTAPVPCSYEGPVARVLGLLEASLGRHDAALARFEPALARCRAHGFRPWVARLALELGTSLRALGRETEARAAFEEARSLASTLGMKRIEARAARALGSLEAPAQIAPGEPATLELIHEGEVWSVRWPPYVARVRDSRGVQLLAKLVAAPGERLHALALVGEGDAFLPESDAGEALDRKAVSAYRARLSEIDDELARAEAGAEAPREKKLRRERQMLVAEISRAVGLGGRLRKVGSATERARINATRRLKDAISRIAEASPELGRHLERVIRTGTYCVYQPKP